MFLPPSHGRAGPGLLRRGRGDKALKLNGDCEEAMLGELGVEPMV